MWGYIGKALNSSLGTDEFKPLDKIILSQRNLVASDNPFYTLLSPGVSTNKETYQTAASFTAKTNGSVRIVVNASASTSSTSRVDIGVFEGDIHLVGGRVLGWDATDVAFDVKITKGNTYSIKFKAYDAYTVSINNIKINANIVDGSLIEEV